MAEIAFGSYIFERLKQLGVKSIFSVPGGVYNCNIKANVLDFFTLIISIALQTIDLHVRTGTMSHTYQYRQTMSLFFWSLYLRLVSLGEVTRTS